MVYLIEYGVVVDRMTTVEGVLDVCLHIKIAACVDLHRAPDRACTAETHKTECRTVIV